jgi:hypothetical protein
LAGPPEAPPAASSVEQAPFPSFAVHWAHFSPPSSTLHQPVDVSRALHWIFVLLSPDDVSVEQLCGLVQDPDVGLLYVLQEPFAPSLIVQNPDFSPTGGPFDVQANPALPPLAGVYEHETCVLTPVVGSPANRPQKLKAPPKLEHHPVEF